ncbi:MAG TPA: hypothetical protein VEW72_06910, partial [Burkholderiales bacterium]|nr:hypothetical protein [Burkholderiales bacterium]
EERQFHPEFRFRSPQPIRHPPERLRPARSRAPWANSRIAVVGFELNGVLNLKRKSFHRKGAKVAKENRGVVLRQEPLEYAEAAAFLSPLSQMLNFAGFSLRPLRLCGESTT